MVTLKSLVLWPLAARLDGVTPLGLVAGLALPLHAAAAIVSPSPITAARRERPVILALAFFTEISKRLLIQPRNEGD
jgi:hypothetical protein